MIEHRYGSTEIPALPERIVTVGLTDHDTVLALGVTPVALIDWFGDQPNGVWPWAQDLLGHAAPVVLNSQGINLEQVAAAGPDPILAVNSGLTQQKYDTLSRIAPTVAQSGEYPDFGTPWQEQTRIIGTARVRADRAEQVIDQVEATFAAARDENPGFDGATGVIALIGEDSNYYPMARPTPARGSFQISASRSSRRSPGSPKTNFSPPSAPSASTCSTPMRWSGPWSRRPRSTGCDPSPSTRRSQWSPRDAMSSCRRMAHSVRRCPTTTCSACHSPSTG